MTAPSTYTSRNLYVDAPQVISFVYVKGEYPFPVEPAPFHAPHAGAYRAELDLEAHTATITEVTA